MVERALLLDRTGPPDFKDLPAKPPEYEKITGFAPGEDFLELDEIVSLHIRRVLERTDGRIHGPGGVVELPGINPSTLRSRMKRLGSQ